MTDIVAARKLAHWLTVPVTVADRLGPAGCRARHSAASTSAELIRSTRAPTKDRLKGKIMSGNPVFRGTRVPVHMLAGQTLLTNADHNRGHRAAPPSLLPGPGG